MLPGSGPAMHSRVFLHYPFSAEPHSYQAEVVCYENERRRVDIDHLSAMRLLCDIVQEYIFEICAYINDLVDNLAITGSL